MAKVKSKSSNYFLSVRLKAKHAKKVRRGRMLLRRNKPMTYSGINRAAKLLKRRIRRRPLFLPPHSTNVTHIISRTKELDLNKYLVKKGNGLIKVPKNFSLVEAPKESYHFLLSLFGLIYNDATHHIQLDYSDCETIDLDAQVLMDVLLKDLIWHLDRCKTYGNVRRLRVIEPINFQKEHILKVLFSVGSFRVLKDFKIDVPGIVKYTLCIGSKNLGSERDVSSQKEVHTTQLIDYVIDCLATMKQTLTPEAKSDLCQVVGEVLINAEEHGTTDHRYSIGYFEKKNKDDQFGVFNLVIFNFGQTIYEKFKDPECPTKHIVARMKALSEDYTTRGFFFPAEFEEETLWTLYSLQEGVTSKTNYAKRGNGSIRFIESFLNLKGNGLFKDDVSKLVILSGNTKIIFDGSYPIAIKQNGENKFKVVSFNNSGSFNEKPNKNYVTFAENYFPGTMIIAKILIREDDLTTGHGNQHNTNH